MSAPRLAYDDEGRGPAVLLLHAGIADRRMWAQVAADLVARGYRVIRPDLRGYGHSRLAAGEPVRNHDDVVRLLDALGVERIPIAGCSMGGAVAIDTAIAHPDRVSGLVLVGANVSGSSWSDELRATWDALCGDVDEDDLDALAAAEVRFWVVGPDRRTDDVDPALLALAGAMDRAALAGEELIDRAGVQWLEPPAQDRLAEVRAPAWVLAGAADLPEVRARADRLAAGMPRGVRLPDVPDAAHLAPLERPAALAATLDAFLLSLARTDSAS
jgi:3-oxoadipate enol-lactonase